MLRVPGSTATSLLALRAEGRTCGCSPPRCRPLPPTWMRSAAFPGPAPSAALRRSRFPRAPAPSPAPEAASPPPSQRPIRLRLRDPASPPPSCGGRPARSSAPPSARAAPRSIRSELPWSPVRGPAPLITTTGRHGRLAFSTDGYVVNPLEFPGGDSGRLAVVGTCNDLAMAGARPWALSLGLILEEGLELALLRRILASVAAAATDCAVQVVTGDTKVVEPIGPGRIEAGDQLVVSGDLGRHGMAILMARHGLEPHPPLLSDCAPLWPLEEALLARGVRPHLPAGSHPRRPRQRPAGAGHGGRDGGPVDRGADSGGRRRAPRRRPPGSRSAPPGQRGKAGGRGGPRRSGGQPGGARTPGRRLDRCSRTAGGFAGIRRCRPSRIAAAAAHSLRQ
jgi:hypothetical protein